MNRLKRILILMVLFLNACATNHSGVNVGRIPSDIPNPLDLKNKIAKLCEAQMKKDWLAWYNLTTFALEKKVRPEEVERRPEEKDVNIVSCSTSKFIRKPVSQYEKDVSAIVAVEMDVFGKRGSDEPQKIKDLTDYWVYMGNSWYWRWRGFPSD